MARAPVAAVGLLVLLPAAALAHGEGSHPPDPALHVDSSLEDCSVIFAPELTQSAFRRFAREFGSVSAFKQGSPPTTLGKGGFSVGLQQIFFSVDERSDAWNDTFHHPDAYHELGSDLSFPKLSLRVGVRDDLDVGAFYAQNPEANYGWLGLDVKYAILEQREDMPVTLAVRGAYTKTLYVADMDMHALSLDVSVGRTFWNVVTPYLGLGSEAVLARETTDAVDLQTEGVVVPRLTGGVELRYWHVALGAEANLSDVDSFQAQLSAVF
jgi:hypothetical protein